MAEETEGGMSVTERKFEKGARIMSVGQFAALGSQWFFLGDRPKHRSFIENMQYRTLANLIRAGRLYEAIPFRCIGNTARAVFTEEIET